MRILSKDLIKDKEYIFLDYPTQHSYRSIYIGIKEICNENLDWNTHEFRVFPRTICLNKPFTLRLLSCEIDKSLDIMFTEIEPDSRWN